MEEKTLNPISGYIMLLVLLLTLVVAGFGIATGNPLFIIGGIILTLLILPGFFFVNPNGSRVLVLFGDYKGSVKKNGFYWVNPFYSKQKISLRARNFDSERIKVNDKRGNPILISVILVWKVSDTFKAAFEVDNYESFVKVQSEAAVRHLAALYSYDNFEEGEEEITLRSSFEEVNEALEKELAERLAIAGIHVLEARIGYLAYAEEIASAMLKRQQAEAIVAARFKIVEGAVGMVEQALDELSKKDILHLDDEKKATMVSNLMVVLCSERETSPVVNAGSIY
jgi:regulator of protease activity HflC (stomatin/prohibitin superfamily)